VFDTVNDITLNEVFLTLFMSVFSGQLFTFSFNWIVFLMTSQMTCELSLLHLLAKY